MLVSILLLSENGFIEDEELDGFLREFVTSVNVEEDLEVGKGQPGDLFVVKLFQVTEETLAELKACFLEAYDDNKDGKIDIREVVKENLSTKT